VENDAVVAAAHDIAGWLAAHGAGLELYGEVPKWIVEIEGTRYFQVPRLDISLPLPADAKLPRYQPLPRRHTTRPQRDLTVQYWVFASASDATTTVAVARLESGNEDEWTAHIGRGPYTQYIDRFSAGKMAGIASSVAPTAAHIALIAADVVMPLQAEVERLLKPPDQ
jgi:hypothetical protein